MIKSLILLFLNFFKLGLFSIGGGYAIIPLIQHLVVYDNTWLSISEFTDIITISQMTPGPLAVNTATFVGLRINGIYGAIVTTLGTILSGFIISILLYIFFTKFKANSRITNVLEGLKASSIGLITSAASTILLISFFDSQTLKVSFSKINYTALTVFTVSLYVLRKYKINLIILMIITGFIGILVY